MQHLGNPATRPGQESPEPDGEVRSGFKKRFTLFGKQATQEPDWKKNQGGAKRTINVPIPGVRMQGRNRDGNDEAERNHLAPSKTAPEPTNERIERVVNLLAEKAPQRRVPKNRV